MTSLSHCFLLFLTLCLCCAACMFTARGQVITSVSGCVDVGRITVNCTFPTYLAVTTDTAFEPSTTPTLALVLKVRNTRYSIYGLIVDTADPTNRTVVAMIPSYGYNMLLFDTLFNISLYNYETAVNSPDFSGVSFAFAPPPSITSISGCHDNGSGTYGCIPDQTTLTLRGTGFDWLSARGTCAVCVGSQCVRTDNVDALVVVNATYATFFLGDGYVFLTPLYNGTLLPFYIQLYNVDYINGGSIITFVTNAVTISLAPLPPPLVTSLRASGGCVSFSSAPLTYVSCIPIVSYLQMSGSYLGDSNITVNGYRCLDITTVVGSPACRLPNFLYTPGEMYDVVVTTPAGMYVLPGTIGYTSAPSVTGVSSGKTIQLVGLAANPANYFGGWNEQKSTVVISGALFHRDPTMVVVLSSTARSSAASSSVNVTCLEPLFISSTAISCVLPSLEAGVGTLFWGVTSLLQVFFNSSSVATNQLSLTLYDYPDAPVVTSVSGCGTTVSLLDVSVCNSGSILTITGRNFAAWNMTRVESLVPYFLCIPSASSTDSLILCTLPVVGGIGGVAPYTSYVMSVYAGMYKQSNIFHFSFTSAAESQDDFQHDSSSLLVEHVLIGVFVPCGVIALGMGVLILFRRRAMLVSRSDSRSAINRSSRSTRWSDRMASVEMD